MRSGLGAVLAVGVGLGAALARANGPVGDAPVYAKIEALRPVAAALAIDGDGADWGAIPSLPDPNGDAGGDGSRDITGLAIAPLVDSLAVRITTAAPPSTYDLSFWLYIDYMGREQVDLSEIGLYPGFDDIVWIYPEGGTPSFHNFHDAALAIGNVVEARIPYATLAAAFNDANEPYRYAALGGPNARSYVRVTVFTRDYSQPGVPVVDWGPAVASFRLVPTPYTLDPPLPQPGTPVVVPPALAGSWYVGKGPFTDGAHAGSGPTTCRSWMGRSSRSARAPRSRAARAARGEKALAPPAPRAQQRAVPVVRLEVLARAGLEVEEARERRAVGGTGATSVAAR